MIVKQNTIAYPVTITGKGLHTGVEVSLTFKPAPENFGFRFKRIDLDGKPVVEASVSKVRELPEELFYRMEKLLSVPLNTAWPR